MPKPMFFQDKCKGCELCTAACPKKLIEMSTSFNARGYQFAICPDDSKCTGCALCGKACPDCAIEIYR